MLIMYLICGIKGYNLFSQKYLELWTWTWTAVVGETTADCSQSKESIIMLHLTALKALHWETCHANVCDIFFFIEREEQSHKQNNTYQKQNLWIWHSVTNWMRWHDRNREMLFICYTQTNFMIHNSLYTHFAIAIHTVFLSELLFWICKSF